MASKSLKGIIVGSICLFVITGPTASGNSQPFAGDMTKIASLQLRDQLSASSSDSLFTVIVFLDEVEPAYVAKRNTAAGNSLAAKRRSVVSALSNENTARVQSFIDSNSNLFESIQTRHWIVPAVTAVVTAGDIARLSQISSVRRIVEDAPLHFDDVVEKTAAPALSTGASSSLQQLNVPSLWSRGFTGEGRLVCSFDTGVEGTHPALSTKWRGNNASLAESWFSKVTPNNPPSDIAGHGTHTMGVMVGHTAADTFGVAPDAEWISAGIIDQAGRGLSQTISDIIEAFQWALDPDGDPNTTSDVPDVILNSWGIPRGLFEPCDDTFYGVIDAAEAAGIVIIFACGNEGPDPMTLRSPADRASNPLNSFTVGAVDENFAVANFSSRGPSSCDQTSIKPEVMAPGVLIRSSYKDGTYKYMSGTSMAAPYIAGLVALMREYNPDASVLDIKNAFIQSAIDLAPVGEDNASGYGFVDASKLLEHLPAPASADVSVSNVVVDGDGIAMPGETVELTVSLYNPAGNLETISGVLTPINATEANVATPSASFSFGSGGTSAVQNLPFVVEFNSDLYHGQAVDFELLLQTGSLAPFDTASISVTVGLTPAGDIDEVSTPNMNLTISEFAQFGLSAGSIYNLNGVGLTYQNSQNLLYEGGLLVGRSSLQMSTALRDATGEIKPSDFVPTVPTTTMLKPDGGNAYRAVMRDNNAFVSLPIEVAQEVITYQTAGDDGFVIVSYTLRNYTAESLTGMRVGFAADFDLPGGNDGYHFDPESRLLYQENGIDPSVGIVALSNVTDFATFDNSTGKVGFTNGEWYSMLSSGTAVDSSSGNDLGFLLASQEFSLAPGDTLQIAFAFVAGSSTQVLLDNAEAAKGRFLVATDVNDGGLGNIPDKFTLHQNYPNPFNPTTTIAFELPRAADVSLEVFNILGQRVVTLYDNVQSAGHHQVVWDATNSVGHKVASGVYYYKLTVGDASHTRQMVVLK